MSAADSSPYDLLVLGGGPAGYAAALRAAQLDLRVALVESDQIGGTCLHRGCVPAKSLLHSGHVADMVRNAGNFGVSASLHDIDVPAMHKHKNSVVRRLYKGLQGLVSAANIEVFAARGTLTSPTTVDVGGQEISANHILIATGARARTLEALPTSDRVLTSTQALELDTIPGSVVVLGGGVIGVEFASLWASLGSRVTIVEASDSIVPGEDSTIRRALHRALTRRGITINTGVTVKTSVENDDGVTLTLSDGQDLSTDVVLVSIGREPATAGLGLDEVGVLTERGFIATDAQLRTNVPGFYAAGDVVGGLQLAHRGFAHGIYVAEHIAGLEPAQIVDHTIPRVTYSDPEVASVGLTEERAREQFGDNVSIVDYDLAGNGRTQIQGGRGMVKVVRRTDGPIVGLHLVGPGVGELIGEAHLMVGWGAYPEDVAPLVHAHPTQNESLGEAALALSGKPLHFHH